MGVRGVTPGKILTFETQFGAFGKKLTVLQFSTIVNENIAIVLDSCIDIVACY